MVLYVPHMAKKQEKRKAKDIAMKSGEANSHKAAKKPETP